MIALDYRYGNGPEKTYRSSERQVVIGRPKDVLVDLDLSPDTKVSRPHARLFYDLSTWWIEDLGSKHGLYLNGQRLAEATTLAPGDQLQLGDTLLRVRFPTLETALGPGMLESIYPVNELQPPASVAEDQCLEILANISRIAAYSRGQLALLEGFLHAIGDAFPTSERRTILLIEDREIVPRVFWPPNQSYASFTIARRAIRSQQALSWVRQIAARETLPIAESLQDTAAALYAPMLANGHVVGVVHVDTTSLATIFSEQDVQLLSVIANTMGPALKVSGAGERLPAIFISYAHKDRDVVNRLVADLRRRRVKVWFDERLRGGPGWRKQLATAIEQTDAFVLVMSPSSVASEYVEWELDMAQALSKTIFPLMYQESIVPKTIVALQYIHIGADYQRGIDELVERLYEEIGG